MAAIVLPLTFILVFLAFYSSNASNLKETWVKSTLLISVLLVMVTEVLSGLHQLTAANLLWAWLSIDLAIFLLLFKTKTQLASHLVVLTQQLTIRVQNTFFSHKVLSVGLVLLIVLVGVQGLIYPPNNWDSLTYHMSRISHWISQASVAHYPTSIFRQLYQPPFAEFCILHVSLLAKSDVYANWVQFFFWISMVPIIGSIVALIQKRKAAIIGISVLILTIPEAVLQASSTQNDLVLSYFLSCSVYFVLKTFSTKFSWTQIVFAGISIGLTLLTKGTAYLFLAPLGLYFGIGAIKNLTRRNYQFAYAGMLILLLALSINFCHYYRNYKLIQNPLGTDSKMYANEVFGPGIVLSAISKNIGLHIGTFPLNRLYDKVLILFHQGIHIPLNSIATNFLDIPYSGAVTLPSHEDSAPNSLHFYLIVCALLALFIWQWRRPKSGDRLQLYLGLIVGLQFLFFCTYLKWQPWHTRLHLPLFFISVPLIVTLFSSSMLLKKHFEKLLLVLLMVALFAVAFNFSRPLLSNSKTSAIQINSDRFQKYFSNQLKLYPEYKSIDSLISKNHYTNIGLVLIGDSWEYPLFYKNFSDCRNPIHLNSNNPSQNIYQDTSLVQCVISTEKPDSSLTLNGKKLNKQTVKNQFIWMYE
jgi:hypothetical protein